MPTRLVQLQFSAVNLHDTAARLGELTHLTHGFIYFADEATAAGLRLGVCTTAREASATRQEKEREARLARQQAAKLQNLFDSMGKEEQLNVNLLIRADVQGSVEALRDALTRLSNDDVQVSVVASGVGAITENDASLAQASNAIIIGFNVRADATARKVIQDVESRDEELLNEAAGQPPSPTVGKQHPVRAFHDPPPDVQRSWRYQALQVPSDDTMHAPIGESGSQPESKSGHSGGSITPRSTSPQRQPTGSAGGGTSTSMADASR